jgi:hypothetical protein
MHKLPEYQPFLLGHAVYSRMQDRKIERNMEDGKFVSIAAMYGCIELSVFLPDGTAFNDELLALA